MLDAPSFSLVIPTRNGASHADAICSAIRRQTVQPVRCLVIDTASTDGSPSIFQRHGFDLHTIQTKEFDHGATRMIGVDWAAERSDLVVFLTQDALPASDDAFEQLLLGFQDPDVALCYGRQLPRPEAGPIEAFPRMYNYPANSHQRRFDDRRTYGLKTAFTSNSFSAYRVSALISVGGFPSMTVFGEDATASFRLLKSGFAVAYMAKACVYHSHHYSFLEEAKRHFDIGVFHSRSRVMVQELGRAEGHGLDYAKREFAYLRRVSPFLIPEAIFRNATKYVSYRAGLLERWIPRSVKRRVSFNRRFWGA